MAGVLKTVTLAELAKHNTREDLWIAVAGAPSHRAGSSHILHSCRILLTPRNPGTPDPLLSCAHCLRRGHISASDLTIWCG